MENDLFEITGNVNPEALLKQADDDDDDECEVGECNYDEEDKHECKNGDDDGECDFSNYSYDDDGDFYNYSYDEDDENERNVG